MQRRTDQKKHAEKYGPPKEEETETTDVKAIRMPTFVYSSVEWWVDQAQIHWTNCQPMLSFICAWVAFNHCYGLYWTYRAQELSGDRHTVTLTNLSGEVFRVDSREYVSDNVQIATFIGKRNPGFGIFWKQFLATKDHDMAQKITLPVTDLTGFKEIPDAERRTVKLLELELPTLFRILLTIRNNLFHGGKKVTERRHLDVCSCAAEFMVPFVTELTKSIEGV